MVSGHPDVSEYPDRYGRYIDLVPEEDICGVLVSQLENSVAVLSQIPESKVDWRYAPGKWTIRDVVGHVLDIERVFGFRLMAFSRGETATFPRANEELYVKNADFSRYSLGEWLDEFVQVRNSHVTLIRHLPADAWARVGTVALGPISVRAMAFLMVGHERHHLRIIREKYLNGL
jgi:hypothetical protein